jgi:pSer/pThr/pTyr-binding forkhead associated (FHA) protein
VKLVVYKKDQVIQELVLKPGKVYTAGRKEDCDILLEKLPGISRKHFELSEQQPGIWHIQVHSKVMLIEYEDDDRDDFTIVGKGQFLLRPYLFKFDIESSQQDSFNDMGLVSSHDQISEDDHVDHPPQSDLEPMAADLSAGIEDEANLDYSGSDEKTSVQNFTGTPYIKIVGQSGKKSEYFRLEGNLWIVGDDESASIYIKEPNAAKNHFEISKTDKGFFIIDNGSELGTDLNGQRLISNKPTRLLSGDIISVGSCSLQFELRDQAFQRKVSNIPLNMYKNPLVFFDQEVAMVNLDDKDEGPGRVEEVSQNIFDDPQKKKKFIMMAVAVVLISAAVAKEFMATANEKDKVEVNTDPFSQLSPAEQKIVAQTHKLAKQLYLNGNFELALVQLEKLHSIIPSYKDSQEMEEHCINSREIKRQQALIEQQRREQEQMEQKVNSLLSQCYQKYKNSDDIDGVKACLAPAVGLDPNNPGIAQLISDVTARSEEQEVRAKMARELEDKIRRGRELFESAKELHRKQNYLQAMEAYENHIHSGLPDPNNLVKKSKRELSSIENKIRTEKQALLGQAQSKYGSTHLKEAIYLARRAQKVDPYDPQISAFIHQAELELTNKMRNIFIDSVIEEKFGNLEASRLKWEEIIRMDVESGEYFKKSKRKLRQYGYHP